MTGGRKGVQGNSHPKQKMGDEKEKIVLIGGFTGFFLEEEKGAKNLHLGKEEKVGGNEKSGGNLFMEGILAFNSSWKSNQKRKVKGWDIILDLKGGGGGGTFILGA